MLFSAAAAKQVAAVAGAGIMCSAMYVMFLPPGGATAGATDTQINARVCGPNSASTLSVSSPLSDSVVTSATVRVEGEVHNASQIDVAIDGQYNSTLPLNNQQTDFMTTLSLGEGTHTIDLRALDICQGQDGVASLIITYQPQSTPSSGNDSTIITNAGGIRVSSAPSDQSSRLEQRSAPYDVPVVGPLLRIANSFLRAADLDVTVRDNPIKGIARIALATIGAGLAVFGIVSVQWFSIGAAWAATAFSKKYISKDAVIRVIGGAILLVAFLI